MPERLLSELVDPTLFLADLPVLAAFSAGAAVLEPRWRIVPDGLCSAGLMAAFVCGLAGRDARLVPGAAGELPCGLAMVAVRAAEGLLLPDGAPSIGAGDLKGSAALGALAGPLVGLYGPTLGACLALGFSLGRAVVATAAGGEGTPRLAPEAAFRRSLLYTPFPCGGAIAALALLHAVR